MTSLSQTRDRLARARTYGPGTTAAMNSKQNTDRRIDAGSTTHANISEKGCRESIRRRHTLDASPSHWKAQCERTGKK
jgi:hypothetical protein